MLGFEVEDTGEDLGWVILALFSIGLLFVVARQGPVKDHIIQGRGLERKSYFQMVRGLMKVHVWVMGLAVLLSLVHGGLLLLDEGLDDDALSGLVTLAIMLCLAILGLVLKVKASKLPLSRQTRIRLRSVHINKVGLLLVLAGLGIHILG